MRHLLFLFQIAVVIALVQFKPFGGHFRHAGGHAVYEPAVVGHGEYSAFVVHKRVLKHLAGVHVQMVGGFVQYEQVVVPEHELAQRHPPALAAGQSAHLAEHILAREQEQPQRASDFTRLEQGKVVPDFAQYVFFRVQVGLFLVVVTRVHVGSEQHAAAVPALPAHDNVEQRGLAYAVGAYDRHTVAAFKVQVQVFEQGPPVEALFEPLDHKHVVSRAPAAGEGEAHMLVAHGLFQTLYLFQPFFTALGGLYALFTVEGTVAADDLLFPADGLLLQFVVFYLLP